MSDFLNYPVNYLFETTDKINFYENQVLITATDGQQNRQGNVSYKRKIDNINMIDEHNVILNSVFGNSTNNDYVSNDAKYEGNIIINESSISSESNSRKRLRGNGTSKVSKIDNDTEPCRVCGETKTTGLHYGTVTCEACKKFFLRNIDAPNDHLKCVRNTASCVITKVTRTNCPYCRLKKCLFNGMNVNADAVQSTKVLQCQVCTAPSSGIHFGVVSCEGCKGFFRRTIAHQAKLQCLLNGTCEVNPYTRNCCRLCRLNRCLAVGMSLTNMKVGRQSNLFKTKLYNSEMDQEQAKCPKIEQEIQLTEQQHVEQQMASIKDLELCFDSDTRDVIKMITTSYYKNMEENVKMESFQYQMKDECVGQIVNFLESHAIRCITFLEETQFFKSEDFQAKDFHADDRITMLANSVHSLRLIWIHKQNKHLNYLNCDEQIGNYITDSGIFGVFSKTNEQLKHLHVNYINKINMDNIEYILFSLICVFSGNYSNRLVNPKKINSIKGQIMRLLSKYMLNRRNENESFQSLMQLLITYSNMNIQIQLSLHQFVLDNHSLQAQLPPFFKNTYLRNGFAFHFKTKI